MHEMPWLLKPPADFRLRCENLATSFSLAADVRALAGCFLSTNQSNRLFRVVRKLSSDQLDLLKRSFQPLKMGILSNGTFDLITPVLFTTALRHGVFLECITTDFNQVAQEAFDANSKLNTSQVDVVLLAIDYRAYPPSDTSATAASAKFLASDAQHYINELRSAIRKNSGAQCIVQTLAPPPYPLLGNIDIQTNGILRHEISEFNRAMADTLKDDADLLFDVASLAANVGDSNWYSERQWYLSRIPMAPQFIPLYADRIACTLAALRGLSKKCLILDLDNTLWAGVIGDDGIDGIVLGEGDPKGESHLALQQMALDLKRHGVVLAVCSKNDEVNARKPFREHPDMLLSEADIAVFISNWCDKASNIREIAQRLNIGLDSLVFVDDNPAERDIVRMILPDVSVPELPTDAALFPRMLSYANYFEINSLTDDDQQRASQYEDNEKRQTLAESSISISSFLESLNMEMAVSPFDKAGRKRIVQLINKTNQFNLTTRRYTEADIIEFENSPDTTTLQIRLTDRFGDNGMISVVICRQKANEWQIDTWLMSCRVIKRDVEFAVCDELVRHAKEQGIERIIGTYIPSKKNSLVRHHYEELGFKPKDSLEEGDRWELSVEKYQRKSPQIKIVES